MDDTPGPVTPPDDWPLTPRCEPRGHVQPHALTEIWFHTVTPSNR